MTTATLPPYPSFHARFRLSHTQLASINQKISQSIQHTLDLPPHALNSATPAAFISSYARDVAQHNLDALIWDADPKQAAKKPKSETTEARAIHVRTLLLAERLASSTPGALDPTTLLDLSIAYASHPTRLRALFTSAFSKSKSSSTSPLLASTTASALPAFTSVLISHTTIGLHGLRKTAHAILCLLRVAPGELLRAFALSKDFTLALAQAYDAGLGAASTSYGRLHLPVASAPQQRDLDDWEVLFLQTKADLLDAFHILLTALLNAADPAETERAFDTISALHALPAPPRPPDDPTRPTPFLNRSLLADYQHAYDLSATLPRALAHGIAADDDARLEWLSGALRELDADLDGGGSGPSAAGPARRRDPGAFRLLLGPAIGDPGHVGAAPASDGAAAIPSRGAEVATPSGSSVVDLRVEEVRAILPDYEPEYIGALLQRTEYGSVERVVEALLEGTAPPPEAIQRQQQQQQATSKAQKPPARDEFEYTRERRNVFDGEEMDVSKLRIGKKSDDAMTVLRDRSFVEQMKTDILRRVEAPSDSEDEETTNIFGLVAGKRKMREVAFDDELDDVGSVRVAGDGEDSSVNEDEDEDGREEDSEEPEMTPQTIVELAYVANPKAFERDAATRRSKERAALRAQTGWVDEQIEGFRIMLDRDPKMKERMLAKHEFSGNKPLAGSSWSAAGPSARSQSRNRSGTPDPSSARGGRGRRGGQTRGHHGHGRGGGRGGGRGRGGQGGTVGKEAGDGDGGGGGDGGADARGRAWKDKHKARQANHDRKRGHDKKMAKAGGPSS